MYQLSFFLLLMGKWTCMGYPRPHKLPVPETTDLTLVIVFGIDIIHFVFHLHLLFCRYHHFRRSRAGIHNILTCVPESSNIYDRWAVTAVQDDMGNVIGRVPKNICNIISISQSVPSHIGSSYMHLYRRNAPWSTCWRGRSKAEMCLSSTVSSECKFKINCRTTSQTSWGWWLFSVTFKKLNIY